MAARFGWRATNRMTYRRFLECREFLRLEEQDTYRTATRADWQMAQVAYELYCISIQLANVGRKRDDVLKIDKTVEDFLVQYKTRRAVPVRPAASAAPNVPPTVSAEQGALSKSIWLSWAKVKQEPSAN